MFSRFLATHGVGLARMSQKNVAEGFLVALKGPRGRGAVSHMEPGVGIEPTTTCLQDKGSTIELHRHRVAIVTDPPRLLATKKAVELRDRLGVETILDGKPSVGAVGTGLFPVVIEHVYLVRKH